jgi:hypothetical protein
MTGKNTLNTLYNDTLSIKILILKLPYLYRFRIKLYIFLELHSASIYLMMDDSTQKINSLMLFTRQNGMCQ